MASEILLPATIIQAGMWTKEGGGAGVVASIDEGCNAPDDETTYIDQADDNTFSAFRFHLSDPVGVPDTGSGIASWALRVRLKYVDVAPFAVTVQLRSASGIITEFDPSVSTSYQTRLLLFDPAAIANVNDLRLWILALPDAGGSVRVTAADLVIQVFDAPPTEFQDGLRVQVS